MTVAGAPWWEGHPDLLPPDPPLEPLHARNYSVRAWRISDEAMLLRGAVMDLRPGAELQERIVDLGGHDDGAVATVHHMVVDLTVAFPSLTITDAQVVFHTFPQPGCPAIADRYRELVGLSIARGFTHEIRQRFGGPRGCTHTTALLQAMAPVAVQCIFAMRRGGPGPIARATRAARAGDPGAGAANGALAESGFMRDTCHVWSADGEVWQGVTMGRMPPLPLPMQERMRAGGLDPEKADPRG